MTNITFPLSEANVAQCMAERDAEIERLRKENELLREALAGRLRAALATERESIIEPLMAEIKSLRALRCSCQIADHISDECARLGKCKERHGEESV